MRPDGTITRDYEIALQDCVLNVREMITLVNEHICVVRTVVGGRTMVATRVNVAGDGRIVFGPLEEFREQGFYCDWLPWDFRLDDFVALVRFR